MKKVLITLLAATLLIACEGPMGPIGPEGPIGVTGPKGEDGEDGGTYWHTTSFNINGNEWKLVGKPGELNSFYYVDIPFSELTDYIYRNGAVVAYIETAEEVKNGLPYVLHLGDKDNLGEFLWTQTYDFDFYPGGISFYVTYSDFNTQIRPGTETFHVVLMW